MSSNHSKRNVLIGIVSAFLVIAAIIVIFVLPAEFGIDPTGLGKATGVIAISQEPLNPYLEKGLKRKGVFTVSEEPLASEPGASDRWEFELGPFESIEFKYVIDEGAAINFFWSATGPLDYDMHAHPFEGGTELTESYSIAKADHLGGRYIAPFTGVHGWYWQNRNIKKVRISVEASGRLNGSKIFDKAGVHDRPLSLIAE